MVSPVAPIASVAASSVTNIDRSTSITSITENVWVAHRQSDITARLAALGAARDAEIPHGGEFFQEVAALEEEQAQHRHADSPPDDGEAEPADDLHEEPLLSGESERIGTGNFDEDTPFGERFAIL